MKLIKDTAQILTENGWMLGVAESCTGGLISSEITRLPGASIFFSGGLVCYTNRTKYKVLGVPSQTIKRSGAVSKIVARKMATATIELFNCDWSISVTGIAGPTGGSKHLPVGLVYCSIVGPGVAVTDKRIFKGNRIAVQKKAALHCLTLLRKTLIRRTNGTSRRKRKSS